MSITSFSQTDHQAVADFWRAIFEELGWVVNSRDGFDDIPKFFHFPQGYFFVVKENENIIGCGGIIPLDTTTGLIKRFYVAPEYRGKGVAEKLLKMLIEESKKRYISRLVLDVFHTNTRAAKFYEKHGFTTYHQEPIPEWEQTTTPDKFFYYQLNVH